MKIVAFLENAVKANRQLSVFIYAFFFVNDFVFPKKKFLTVLIFDTALSVKSMIYRNQVGQLLNIDSFKIVAYAKNNPNYL